VLLARFVVLAQLGVSGPCFSETFYEKNLYFQFQLLIMIVR